MTSEAQIRAVKKYNEKNKEMIKMKDRLKHREKYENSTTEYKQLVMKRNLMSKYDSLACIRYLFGEMIKKGRPRINN